MITVGLLVSNRYDSMIACIKKHLSGKKHVHILPDAKKIADIEQYLAELEDGGVQVVLADISGVSSACLGGLFFDAVIYDGMSGEPAADKSALKHIHSKTIIISNGDDNIIPEFMSGTKLCAVTYGLSQKCSVTASCIDNCEGMSFNCCIQRNIPSVHGGEIEIGEYAVNIGGSVNLYDALAAVTLGMIL